MTTHIVEIRRVTAREVLGDHGTWIPFTREPITKGDAEHLVAMISSHWESRIVAVHSLHGREFAELETMLASTRLGPAIEIARWEHLELGHHPDCTGGKEEWDVHDFGADPSDQLTGKEWLTLHAINRKVSELWGSAKTGSVRVADAPTVHAGRCTGCGARARGHSIKITITATNANGSTTREYRL